MHSTENVYFFAYVKSKHHAATLLFFNYLSSLENRYDIPERQGGCCRQEQAFWFTRAELKAHSIEWCRRRQTSAVRERACLHQRAPLLVPDHLCSMLPLVICMEAVATTILCYFSVCLQVYSCLPINGVNPRKAVPFLLLQLLECIVGSQ